VCAYTSNNDNVCDYNTPSNLTSSRELKTFYFILFHTKKRMPREILKQYISKFVPTIDAIKRLFINETSKFINSAKKIIRLRCGTSSFWVVCGFHLRLSRRKINKNKNGNSIGNKITKTFTQASKFLLFLFHSNLCVLHNARINLLNYGRLRIFTFKWTFDEPTELWKKSALKLPLLNDNFIL
jgi:hypothetical protein